MKFILLYLGPDNRTFIKLIGIFDYWMDADAYAAADLGAQSHLGVHFLIQEGPHNPEAN